MCILCVLWAHNSARWWLVELTSPNTFFSCPAQCTVHLSQRLWTRRTKVTPTTTSTMNGKIWTSKSGVQSRAMMHRFHNSLIHNFFPIIGVIVPETAALLENADLARYTVARNRTCSRIPRVSLLYVLPFHPSTHCLQLAYRLVQIPQECPLAYSSRMIPCVSSSSSSSPSSSPPSSSPSSSSSSSFSSSYFSTFLPPSLP